MKSKTIKFFDISIVAIFLSQLFGNCVLQAQNTKNGGIIFFQNETGGLMAAPSDIGPFSYTQAEYQCSIHQVNGISGWRMPTQSELKLLYQKRNSIGGFNNSYVYWSTTRDNSVSNTAWFIDFNDGEQGFGRYDYGSGPVRCVRNFTNDEKAMGLSAQDIAYCKGLFFSDMTGDNSKYEGLYVYCVNGKPEQTELPDGPNDFSYALINSKGVVLTASGPDYISAFTVVREVTGAMIKGGYYKKTKTSLEQKTNVKGQISIFSLRTILHSGVEKIFLNSPDKVSLWTYDPTSKSFFLQASGSNTTQLNHNLQKSSYSVYTLKFISNIK